jgi:hypothetical protein
MSQFDAPTNASVSRWGRHTTLLAAIILLFTALPVAQLVFGTSPRFILPLTLVLIAAVYSSVENRHTLAIAAVLGVVAVVCNSIGYAAGHDTARLAGSVAGLVLLTFTAAQLFASLLHEREVSSDTIVGGICVYLLLGLCFAISFMLIAELAPTAFSLAAEQPWQAGDRKLDFLYFSFVTLTTLGYGDIAPNGDLAQMLCVAEALIGQLYLAVFVARLVAQHLARPSE